MPNDWDDDDDLDFEDRQESNVVRSLRKAEKEKDKALKAAQEELQSLKSALRDRAVKDAISERGLNAKIAALVPRDIELDSIDSWVESYADVFGVPVQTPSQDNGPAGQIAPEDGQFVDSMNRIGEATGSLQPFNAGNEQQLAQRIAAATTVEELNMLLHGNTSGPAAY